MSGTPNIISEILSGKKKTDASKIRLPYRYGARHFNDEFKNLGYNYRGKIFRRITSPELWGNPLQSMMISRLEILMTYLLEEAKTVKKWFSIAHEKDSIDIN